MAGRLRGDEDLFSLMDEMSSQQGYEKQETLPQEAREPVKRRRLRPEVADYPSENKPAGSRVVWNPHVAVNHLVPSPAAGATNIHVEVFRRRAFERFKQKVLEVFERANGNSTKLGPGNMWRELQVVSMMERWHFGEKLSENLRRNAVQTVQVDSTASFEPSTQQVQLLIDKEAGEWVDPILIGSHDNSRRSGKPHPTNLWIDEIQFDWLRAWRRHTGGKQRDGELENVFQSKKFRKKCSAVSRTIKATAQEVMGTFLKDVSKRASMEITQTKHKKRKNLPKAIEQQEDIAISFAGLNFSINYEHYEKLQIMFDRQNQTSQSLEDHQQFFLTSLFSVLARYDMLQGAGLQAAVQGAVFDVLLKHYNCNVECFASPLNCRYERYFSAFPDTDRVFGSLGSFFDYDFAQSGGSFQANPPFVSSFILAMCQTMERGLEKSEEPLMFSVFVPAWTETAGWKALNDSKYLRKHCLMDQSAHYYAEGTQHRRKSSKRIASFDTSVFFLQNDAGAKKWPVADSHVRELEEAFALNEEDDEKMQPATTTTRSDRKREKQEGSSKSKKRRKK